MTDHVRLEPAKRIQIRAGGQPLVDTTRGYVVHEGGLFREWIRMTII